MLVHRPCVALGERIKNYDHENRVLRAKLPHVNDDSIR